MKTGPSLCLLLAAALALAAGTPAAAQDYRADPATLLTIKRVAERYALTKFRISNLLDKRMNPTPLAPNLPNPFYRPPEVPAGDAGRPGVSAVPADPAGSTVVPAEADESDAGTLAKFASSLKISGLTVRNGVPLLTINQTLSKTGDIIPVEVKGRTVYIQVIKVTPDELTLGLNEERQVIRVRR